MLVFVPDDETYRRTGCLSLVDAGKKLYLIILFTGGRDTGLSRFTTVQLLLDECRISFDPGWASVDHAADTGAVRFAERC